MKEEFLYFLWQNKLFDFDNLVTQDYEKVEVVNTGIRNNDSGPDFFNAKVRVGEHLWAGNVEIHVKSSDWNKHKHSVDKAYDNVILHVVSENDVIVKNSKNRILPTIELKFNKRLYDNYMQLITNKGYIPCSDFLGKIDFFYLKSWQNRLLVERLERKSAEVLEAFVKNNNSWAETFYQFLAKNFGFKQNALPFEMLSKSLPYKYIAKHSDNLTQIEAMLFGQGGFLEDNKIDQYYSLLKREYLYLKNKFSLKSIDSYLWKYMRLRPQNSPFLRLSQFANLLSKRVNFFYEIIETEDIEKLKSFFKVNASNYWTENSNFEKKTEKRNVNLGEDSLNNILINTVSLFLFSFGLYNHEDRYSERALNLLETIKSEQNNIIDKWENVRIKTENSYESQSLIELYNEYCSKGKCINCSIGAKIIIKL